MLVILVMKGINIKTVIFFFFFLISLAPFTGVFDSNRDYFMKINHELYDKELSSLDNVNKIISYTDSLYNINNKDLKLDTSVYVFLLSETIKHRFQFGLAHYTVSDNWIASLLGHFFWKHFSAIVKPGDILKHPNGLCSQQTIVFMESLKFKNIKCRSIGFGKKEGPGHFLCEVYYNSSWHLYDVTKEPTWNKIRNQHESVSYYISNKDSLYKIYENIVSPSLMDAYMSEVKIGKTNQFPASNMLLFHTITYGLTFIIPILLLVILLMELITFKQKK